MELSTILFGGLVFLVVLLYKYLTKNRGRLETLGIPVDPPFLCFGSPPFALHKNYVNKTIENNIWKYGKTYGRYDGVTPVVVTIDPEIIKSVLVKNFDSFTDPFNIEVTDKLS